MKKFVTPWFRQIRASFKWDYWTDSKQANRLEPSHAYQRQPSKQSEWNEANRTQQKKLLAKLAFVLGEKRERRPSLCPEPNVYLSFVSLKKYLSANRSDFCAVFVDRFACARPFRYLNYKMHIVFYFYAAMQGLKIRIKVLRGTMKGAETEMKFKQM